ncbi:MAG TPA: hypothetical protein VF824_01955 [Thermoanaerobaculia bacterium]
MFESLELENASTRLRAAAMFPLLAYVFAQFYFTLYPLLVDVAPWSFWLNDIVLGAGSAAGLVGIAGAVRRERVRGKAIGWLIAACIIEFLCARLFVAITFPWL